MIGIWPYKNISREEFEDKKVLVSKILQEFGCTELKVNLTYPQKTTTFGRYFEETWISEGIIYQYKDAYYRIDEILFPNKPFIVIECADTLGDVIENTMEDSDPFPYDLDEVDIGMEVKYSLGIEPYPITNS